MKEFRLTTRDAVGSFETRSDGTLPVRAEHAEMVAPDKVTSRSWFRRGLRVVWNAAIAVALMAAVPLALVSINGDSVWRQAQWGVDGSRANAIAERSRSLLLPRDMSITATQAGAAYAALSPVNKNSSIPLFEPASRPMRIWETLELTEPMFPTARPHFYSHVPSSVAILDAVANGFSPDEKAYLRAIATAPIWNEFDIVARAPAVDILGGMIRFPLPSGVRWEEMPITRFGATKALAYASVSRAAYHLSNGQRDSAESALRSVVSYGFALIDNATSTFDQMVGNVVVGIGRDALRRFYEITKDPRATQTALVAMPKWRTPQERTAQLQALRSREPRGLLISRATDPSTPRGERFEALRTLSMSSCSNVRDLVLGPRPDVVLAMETAKRILGRFPSEREIASLAAEPMVVRPSDVANQPLQWMVVSVSSVPGVLLNRPQLGTCSLVASQGLFGR